MHKKNYGNIIEILFLLCYIKKEICRLFLLYYINKCNMAV